MILWLKITVDQDLRGTLDIYRGDLVSADRLVHRAPFSGRLTKKETN